MPQYSSIIFIVLHCSRPRVWFCL